MKKRMLLIGLAVVLMAQVGWAAPYEANWESLDSRATPGWFEDAKFGIFIHWGPYSVPAWSPKGTYSEWYQHWLQEEKLFGNGQYSGKEVAEFHKATYGDADYYAFGEQFTADLFEPDRWAELFEQAGAKYIVITTKHHDGFCLWPSKEANDRGFPWNSMEVGAKRDLIGDLTKAVKATEVKMGFYYSLYEWYHPLWGGRIKERDRERYVAEHMHPQFKDLVTRYNPDIMWGDGEWAMASEAWRTPELMSWLFNESPVKDTVVINDRWGKETRHNHGGYYTTEYGAEVLDKPWEECRGMGFSFGYNCNEDAEDYNSPRSLVLMLVDIVSNGGALLLDIGPDGRGRIPVIMQERLLQIGKWLELNGETIYGTRKWHQPCQWSEGKQDYKPEKTNYLSGDLILKLTVDPEPGFAVKELIFTRKDSTLFAIAPQWPGKALTIQGVQGKTDTEVTLLATGETLQWKNSGDDLVIALPDYDPNKFTTESAYAYAFKITGAAK